MIGKVSIFLRKLIWPVFRYTVLALSGFIVILIVLQMLVNVRAIDFEGYKLTKPTRWAENEAPVSYADAPKLEIDYEQSVSLLNYIRYGKEDFHFDHNIGCNFLFYGKFKTSIQTMLLGYMSHFSQHVHFPMSFNDEEMPNCIFSRRSDINENPELFIEFLKKRNVPNSLLSKIKDDLGKSTNNFILYKSNSSAYYNFILIIIDKTFVRARVWYQVMSIVHMLLGRNLNYLKTSGTPNIGVIPTVSTINNLSYNGAIAGLQPKQIDITISCLYAKIKKYNEKINANKEETIKALFLKDKFIKCTNINQNINGYSISNRFSKAMYARTPK